MMRSLIPSLIFATTAVSVFATEKPNIILVITDDQGYGPIGKHGHPWIKTPNLDRLHDQSTRFTRFLVSPTCSPTRAALMSGRHPLKNGITHTILERERMALSTVTLPQVLAKAGYRSGIFGKWHLGDEKEYQPENRGFDETFIHGAGGIGQGFRCSCADVPGNKYFDPVIRHNGSFVKAKGYCTDIFFQAALGWIKEHKETDQPFFAYISTNAPHGPFIAPPQNEKRFTDLGFQKSQAGFYEMIENIDTNMGLLIGKLKQWDLEENTVLVFMSDNGMTGNGAGKKVAKPLGKTPDGTAMDWFNADQKGLKGSPDEGGVRVPCFVRWKGTYEANREIETLTAHIDILPTFAALAGAEVPMAQVGGRNLLPLLEDPSTDWPDRFLFTQVARWKTGSDPNKFQWDKFAVRNERYRLVGEQLYDMKYDPGQTSDIAGNQPEMVAAMRAAYDGFWKEALPLMVNETAPMSPTQPYRVWYKEQQEHGGIPDWKSPDL